jgi:RHS repeat-associated protein
VEPLALPGESYKLAFTPGLLAQVYQRPREGQPPENLLPNPNDILPVNLSAGQIADRGGYVDLDSDGHWWIPTGRTFYSPNISDTAEQELTHAREHFFLPQRYRNPFGQTSTVTYDGYDLLMVETRDPLGNCVTSDNDYRVLQPTLVTDPNHNRSAVAFDALGMVVGTAVMGKPEENLGDSLTGFKSDLTQQEIGDFFTDPKGQVGKDLLKDATTRIIYDVHCYKDSEKPIYAATLAREIHVSDLPANDEPKIQVSFSYSDGFGREIQKKIQAEPGPVEGLGEYVDPRWVGSGWTIFNNKGKPVRQYEPFFSNTHRFEFAKTVGVSPILFYDPLERVVATLHPNHTWEKVVFDPWQQETWDVNDTVQDNPKNDKDVGDYFSRLPDEEYLPTWYEKRKDGAMGLQEQSAAEKAAAHANTPTVAYFDTLGRTFLTIAHNGFDDEGNPIKYLTRINLDIEGNQREVIDAMGRVVMRYEYSMAEPDKKEEEREREEEEKEEQQDSHRIYLCSMDAGERWMLNNVAGNPIRKWDSRGHQIRYVYDELQRQTHLFVAQEDGDEILAERTVYGELHPNAEELNLREKIYQQYDGAGVVTNEEYDFKENLLTSKRQLAKIYNQIVNWSSLSNLTDIQGIANAAASLLEGESFTIRNSYDALNRLINQTTPDESKIKFIYNEANLLEKVEARLRGVEEWTTFVKNIDYNAKGQRKKIEYGNGVYTEYKYDPETFRLINLKTIRTADNKKLQDLKYTYDPVGNITEIQDDAQQTIFFNNAVVTPSAQYEYDALYRLIKADGREHAGQNADIQRDHIDFPRMNLPHPNDGQAMRQYTEHYEYDEVGNILKMIHKANNGDWTRRYDYSLKSNRLLSTSLPGDPDEGPFSAVYEYDANGNITKMPHLQQMQWNFKDKLQEVDLGGGGRAYYVYDSDGQRVRKVHEHNGSTVEEHIYLGGYEVYRKQNGNNLNLERETLHIMDDEKRIAIVETKTHDNGMEVSSPTSLMRYQIDNHLGSSSLELDENGKVISYEEYYPYGNTSYHAVRSDIEVSLKRYRYSGKERDEETGLYYYGARYYAAWLGRWVSCDPAGMVDGVNLYEYVLNNPIRIVDYTGTQCYEDIQMCLPLNQCRLPEYTAKSKLFQQNDGSKIEAASHSQNPNLTNVDLKDVKNLSRIGATLTEGGGVLSILSKITNRKRRIKAIKRWTKKLLQILKKSPKGKKLKELKKLLRRVVSAVKNWGKFGRTVRVLRFLGGGFNVMASIVTGVSQYKESPSRKKIFKLIDAAMTTTLSFIVGRSHPIMYAIDICGGIGIEKFYKGAFHGFSAIAEAAFTEESRGLELWYQRIEKGEWGSVYQSIAKVTKEYSEYWGEEGLIGTLIDFKNELLDILIEMERLIKSYGDR